MKKLFSPFSPRIIRILFTLFTLIALGISSLQFNLVMIRNVMSNDQCGWRPISNQPNILLVTDVAPGGVTDQAGVKNGDTLVLINGRKFRSPNEAQTIIDSLRSGEQAVYTIKRGNLVFDTKVTMLKLFNFVYLANFFLGASFLLVGYIVVMTKPQGSLQRRFAAYTILAMLCFGTTALRLDSARVPVWTIYSILFGFGLSHIFGPVYFITLYFDFPAKKKIRFRKTITAIILILSFLAFFALISPLILTLSAEVRLTLFNIPFLAFVFGLFIFYHSYFRSLSPEQRHPLRHILYASVIGIVIMVYTQVLFIWNPFTLYVAPELLFPTILLIGVPLAYGYSIFRYRLMDIDLLVKRSLIYGLITAALAAIYIAVVFGVGSLIGLILGQSDNQILSIVAFMVIAFVFDPLKTKFQGLVDKLFYSERYNYQQALLEYSRELPRLLELDEVLKSIITRISDTMHVERMAVVLCDTIEGCRTIRRGISEQDCSFNDKEGSLIELLRRTKTPQILDIQDETIMTKLTAEDQRRIIECGIVLAVPLILQDRLIGIIVVGPKLSGRMYSQEDIALLTTVSNQAAVAIENSRLHIAEIEKKKYEEELAIARRIQQGLLPKDVPKIKGLEISGVSVPAMTVGGDYYDFIQLDSKRLLVVVADVSGKGMSAALYMSKIQGMIQFAATMHSSPKDILIQVNKLIFESLERKSFITMIAALFDLNKKKVTICRAGHNKAIVSTKKGLQHLSAVGIGLGLEKGSLFENKLEEVHCPVKSNSLFVFYTDGLTEAMNRERSEFGEERVLELLKKNSHSSVNDIQSTILNDVETFRAGAEQNDDLTLVVVKGK